MKTPRSLGRPLVGLVLLAAFVAIVTVPRCNQAPQTVIIVDTVCVDSIKEKEALIEKPNKKATHKKESRAIKKRVVRQRDYLNERVDSVK